MSLAGEWRFALDRQDTGITEKWFDQNLDGRIQLPGALQNQGFGDDIAVDTKWIGTGLERWLDLPQYEKYRQPGNIKVPFFLQPEKHYTGAAWYQRDIEIPADWQSRRVVFELERAHWETTVWLDGVQIGSNRRLSVPHVYDLGAAAVPGKHRLTVRVDNRMIVDVGRDSHSVSDHTQGNWNGLTGALTLTASDPVWLDDIQVYPDAAAHKVRVSVKIGNTGGGAGSGVLRWAIASADRKGEEKVRWEASGGRAEFEIVVGPDIKLWDEFSPSLHTLELQLSRDGQKTAGLPARKVSFGFRDLGREGTQFTLNGNKIFFRGTLECCIFPLTGYPPTDVESWKRIVRICKAHGLNHIRFHSWCPPEAAFEAADELGFYYQVECASWAVALGKDARLGEWLYDEGAAILRSYGNHPSFVLMAYGNEPKGLDVNKWLSQWVQHWKETDPRHLYTSGAGWPLLAENDYNSDHKPRIQRWEEGLKSIINSQPPQSLFDFSDYIKQHPGKPTISHEIGQWCAFPDFEEISKYTGILKPKNFEIFRDLLAVNQMERQARDFLMASGKLQALCYKADIEAALRTKGFGGFQLLDLHDFPGQGTALVGVLDPFWNSKGYISAEEYRRFCNSVVPLARMKQFTWTSDETLSAAIELANFGPKPLQAKAVWTVRDTAGQIVLQGVLPDCFVPQGNGNPLGRIEFPLSGLKAPAKYELSVALKDTAFENRWDFWVYPAQLDMSVPPDTLITEQLDREAIVRLRAGGKVLLTVPASRVNSDVEIGFSSVFWNTDWTKGQAPHTLGILCDPKHPVFTSFPTEYHSNWQWWELVHGSAAMVLDALPAETRPLVQPIDTWFRSHKLGLLFEAKVEGGRLMVCSMDLSANLEQRPSARQFRRSLLDYLSGPDFKPSVTLSAEQIQALFSPAAQ